MPNKRAESKKLFGVSFDKELLAIIDAECRRLGITRVEFLRQAAEAKIKPKAPTKKP
jgi:metal-responsive CopG/Arc/MetJ family transcriptional regulator